VTRGYTVAMRTTLLAFALAAGCGAPDSDSDVELPPGTGVIPVRSCQVTVNAALPSGATRGEVAGTFSGWAPVPMVGDASGGVVADLGELAPGTYPFKYLWDGAWEGAPPPDVRTAWHNGVENRALVVEDCRTPGLQVLDVTIAGGEATVLLQATAPADAELDPASVSVSLGGTPIRGASLNADGIVVARAGGVRGGKQSVRASIADQNGRRADVWLPLWVQDEPFAWSDGVLYFVMVDRFRDGGEPSVLPIEGATAGTRYRGGDLVGLAQAIREGALDNMGVTSLWISPVVQNPDGVFGGRDGGSYTGYHGYWPSSPRTVEDRFGAGPTSGDQALTGVVEAAHERGIRVMLDVVLNHVHQDHPWVSAHPDWFDKTPCVCGTPGCDWVDQARTCRFASYLPDVEYRNPEAVDAAIDEVWWWLSTYDLDGLRLDAAKHMDHVILRSLSLELQRRIDEQGGDHVLLLGETFAGVGEQDLLRSYIADHELDGQFDFPLMWRTRDVVRGTGTLRAWVDEARAGDRAWGRHVHEMSPFFGNHDIPRLVTALSGCPAGTPFGGCPDPLGTPETGVSASQQQLIDRVTFAWALVVTQPGVPLLYQGDEWGQPGAEDPDNRPDYPWGERTEAQQALWVRIGELAKLRKNAAALRRGERRDLHVEDEVAVIARGDAESGAALVVLSRGGTGTRTVTVPPELGLEGATLVDALTARKARVDGSRVTLPVAPWSTGVWFPE
jgi:glycosidase